jgi:sulfate adenylyltransferase subunit 2
MRTEALKQALDSGGYDIIFGGARRDEEKSRAKERIFSIRNERHGWEPRHQRPELWRTFNTRLAQGQSVRVFPLSNWTEMDIWTYALSRKIDFAPLYFAGPGRSSLAQDRTSWWTNQSGSQPLRAKRLPPSGCGFERWAAGP